MVHPRKWPGAIWSTAMLVAVPAAALGLIVRSAAPEFPSMLYAMMVPPLLVLAVLPLALLAAEAGLATAPKGELDHLLHQKRDGRLDLSRPRFESHLKDELTPLRAPWQLPPREDEDEALDRLVDWKRQHRSPVEWDHG